MKRQSILGAIKKLNKSVFTTYELSAVSGKSSSAVIQGLSFLQRQGVVFKVYRGIWAQTSDRPLSPYTIIPYLFSRHRAYVSFISALHLYGIIEQIPQEISLASTTHTRIIHTKAGTFSVHRIAPSFFHGFLWYKKEGDFLIAEPEKALADCLYLSGYKKRQFSHFPELHFPQSFSFKKVRMWIKKIPNPKLGSYAREKLKQIERSLPAQLQGPFLPKLKLRDKF